MGKLRIKVGKTLVANTSWCRYWQFTGCLCPCPRQDEREEDDQAEQVRWASNEGRKKDGSFVFCILDSTFHVLYYVGQLEVDAKLSYWLQPGGPLGGVPPVTQRPPILPGKPYLFAAETGFRRLLD